MSVRDDRDGLDRPITDTLDTQTAAIDRLADAVLQMRVALKEGGSLLKVDERLVPVYLGLAQAALMFVNTQSYTTRDLAAMVPPILRKAVIRDAVARNEVRLLEES